jgi:(E)-4-hydroxy-3-methylbut-2-enyl-diphosphate synthase
VAIAYGKGSGLIIKKGEVIAKLPTEELLAKFLEEVEIEAKKEQLCV